MKQIFFCANLILLMLLFAETASAERRYFLEEVEITIPDSWVDIGSQLDFLTDKQKIAAYRQRSAEGSLPLIRIIEVAAPGDERGMLSFSIRPCYRGDCPAPEALQVLNKNSKTTHQNLITNDGGKLLQDYGVSTEKGCGGFFVSRGQKIKAPFGGIFISKSKSFYRGNYVIDVSIGYAEASAAEVIERTEAGLNSFRCRTNQR
ncbi:MAG: hypothetical protein IBX47_12895 [Desulfuromonadales bacterium]|nr:hypothetical protein [Desulfuromonadales bacterium]